MDNSIIQKLSLLSDAIDKQQVVAVIGAGISMGKGVSGGEERDEQLPVGSQLVKEWAKLRTYLNPSMQLHEAAFLIKQREGKGNLVKLLQERLGNVAKPTAAHNLIAKLPFVSYISYNFDELLERALEDAGRLVHQIVRESDVSLSLFDRVSVIKPHGTLSQMETIKIASDEVIDINLANPLIFDLLKITIAQRKILYLGFSLKDADFINLHLNVVKKLGEFSQESVAVVLEASDHERSYWREQNVEVVTADLTELLEKLHAIRYIDSDMTIAGLLTQDPWLQDPLFQKLLTIRSLPSETQVIEALLEQVEEETLKSEPADLLARLRRVISDVLSYRENYAAFRQVGDELVDIIINAQSKRGLQQSLGAYRKNRRRKAENLAEMGAEHIVEGDKMFIYSQSKRVIETLKNVPPAVQETCEIFIGECRPKSPIAFQDAYAIYDALKDTLYKLRLVPDSAFAHLVEQGDINKVLFGAHELCEINGRIEYFVNTCGSLMITRICDWYKIPIILIAEKEKIVMLSDKTSLADISRKPEESLTKHVIAELSKLRRTPIGLKISNYGYDVAPVTPGVIVVTDRNS